MRKSLGGFSLSGLPQERWELSTVRVVSGYTAQYPDPITLRAGDHVQVGPDDPEFPGWRWCTGPDRRVGWVPEQLLRCNGQEGVLLRDYTAKELSVQTGAEVTVGETINGWAWVTAPDGCSGWIPVSCITPG